MPNALELPGMLRAVVPLMSGEGLPGLRGGVVHELVALAFGGSRWLSVLFARRRPWLCPGFAAVIGALDDLPEPAAALRSIDAIRVGGRALQVIQLPAGKVGTAYFPLFALTVGCQDESAFACARQYSYSAHLSLLLICSKAAAGAYLLFRYRKVLSFASRFDWYPNLHTAHSGPRIEFLGVTLKKVRRLSVSASDLQAGSREPLVDGIQRFTEL